jgi:GAF domain-containing protein
MALPLEETRLKVLGHYEILDTPPEPDFDRLVQLAATFCGTPIAVISLIDEHRQWFKSKVGLEALETERCVSFCDHTIMARCPTN